MPADRRKTGANEIFALVRVSCSADTFVLKIANFAKATEPYAECKLQWLNND